MDHLFDFDSLGTLDQSVYGLDSDTDTTVSLVREPESILRLQSLEEDVEPSVGEMPPILFDPADDGFVQGGSGQVTELPEIVVTGRGWSPSGSAGGGGWGDGRSYDGDPELTSNPSSDPGTMYDPGGNWWEYGATDEEVIQVHVDLGREPTDEEKVAIELFATRVETADYFVKSLKDTDKITLKSGSQVTGAELKAMWSKVDFVIKPTGTVYVGTPTNPGNGTDRGQSDYNGGDPVVTLNLNIIRDFNNEYAGGIFLPLHELGHLLNASSYRDETDANDIARAIANHFGVATYGYPPDIVYSSSSPLIFSA